jgi:ABC-type glycerol-3-phosphate transport system substrate-binding protein
VDVAEICAAGEDQVWMALCPIRHFQDGNPEEIPAIAAPYPRERYLERSDDGTAPKAGGLVEFYRSPARVLWTPTGVNVPDYGRLAQVWWQNVSKAISGEATAQQAMDGLACDQDANMARLQ